MSPRDPFDEAPGDAPDRQALAGEYVLGTLSAEARRKVEARLAGDAGLRAAVAGWEQRLLPLTALVEPVEPSGALWERITHSVAADAGRVGVGGRLAVPVVGAGGGAGAGAAFGAAGAGARGGWWNSLAVWRGISAMGCAAAVAMASLLVLRSAGPVAPRFLVVLVAPQDKAPGWVVQASVKGSVDLIPLSASAVVPAEKSLQFWTKGEGWKGPVSLGLVRPGQTVHVPLDALPPLEANQLFELTLEPVNGSPLGRPTGPVQFIGRAVRVL